MNLLPQFGFFELMTVAVLVLVIAGPKDLSRMMRIAGRMMRQMRVLAAEFTNAFHEMARETELEELREEIQSIKNDNVVTKTKRDLEQAMAPINDAVRDEANELQDAVNRPVTPTGDKSDPEAR